MVQIDHVLVCNITWPYVMQGIHFLELNCIGLALGWTKIEGDPTHF